MQRRGIRSRGGVAMRKRAFDFIDSNREDMISLWERLVNMDSGSCCNEDVDKVAALLAGEIGKFGGSAEIIEFDRAGNGLRASFIDPTDKPPVCFMGHYDTVFPRGEAARRPFRIEDGKAYGPGVLDMKAGVVIQIFAARALKEAGYTDRQVKIVLAGDEETAHPNSDMAAVFERECAGAVAAFNFETGDVNESLVVGRKGSASYDIVVKGISVHAGREPENGRSAILEIAHKVIDIQALSDFEKGVTFNVGTIKGGVARNAVPDCAEIAVDVRVRTEEQLAWAEERIREIADRTYVEGTSTTWAADAYIPPMLCTEANKRLFCYVKSVAAELGLAEPCAIVSGGGSDSAFSVKAGIPTIDQIGVKGRWNHSDREFAVAETLFERTKLAIACVLDIDRFETGILG